MNQTLQSAGQSFQQELNNGSLNDFDLNWSRNLLMAMLKSLNERLGQRDVHIVPDENVTQLEHDAQQVVTEIQEIEKERENQ